MFKFRNELWPFPTSKPDVVMERSGGTNWHVSRTQEWVALPEALPNLGHSSVKLDGLATDWIDFDHSRIEFPLAELAWRYVYQPTTNKVVTFRLEFARLQEPSGVYLRPDDHPANVPISTEAANYRPKLSPSKLDTDTTVTISIGDPLEDVQRRLGIRNQPVPTTSSVHTHALMLTLAGSGVRIFFDDSQNVYTIRIDAPFIERLAGVETVRACEALGKAPVARAKQIQNSPYPGGSSWILDADSSAKVRCDLDARGTVATVLLSSLTLPKPSGE